MASARMRMVNGSSAVPVASAWRKLIDGHSQVASTVFFSLGVCENNSSLFFLSLAKLCRLKFTFTE